MPDTGNNRIQILGADGDYLATFGSYGTGPYQFLCPTAVAINPGTGDIHVADHCNHRVQVFTKDRVYKATLGVVGEPGSDNAHFNALWGVAVDASGAVYVADTMNGRVQKCILHGTSYTCSTLAGSTGEWGDFGYLSCPRSVAVDGLGKVYVADDCSNRVQVFDANGAYLTTIGDAWGSKTGQTRSPHGVAVSHVGDVYVTDLENHRIQKFALGVPGWRQANINGFGDRNNWGVLALEVFKDDLYAGTRNPVLGASVWRTADGTTWNQVSESGFSGAFGNTNSMVWDLAIFGDQLYATAASDGSGRGQLWRTADGTTWSQIINTGFGDSDDTGVRALAAWGKHVLRLHLQPSQWG